LVTSIVAGAAATRANSHAQAVSLAKLPGPQASTAAITLASSLSGGGLSE
jgi:hypothetical protein